MLGLFGWFVLGLVLLVLGADSFVKGAGGIALKLGIRPFVVGMVLVGFGTSAPELAVNMTAAYQGRYDLAIGNVVGSNIANIGLILGLIALFRPLAVQMRLLRVEVPLLIGIGLVLWLLCLDGRIGRVDGILLLAGFVALMVFVARGAKHEPSLVQDALAETAETRSEWWRSALRTVVGLGLLLYASTLMVESAVGMATIWGMSELIVGLTVVAIGTSLPELAASGIAAWRGHSDIAVGNVVGSCLFNILLILGATASVHPLLVSKSMLWVELPAMIAFSLVLYPMVRGDLAIKRYEGGILFAAFVAFMAWQLHIALT
ncbi:MAG: calcium/sodium antiporter [Lysobacteraceae bacterium]